MLADDEASARKFIDDDPYRKAEVRDAGAFELTETAVHVHDSAGHEAARGLLTCIIVSSRVHVARAAQRTSELGPGDAVTIGAGGEVGPAGAECRSEASSHDADGSNVARRRNERPMAAVGVELGLVDRTGHRQWILADQRSFRAQTYRWIAGVGHLRIAVVVDVQRRLDREDWPRLSKRSVGRNEVAPGLEAQQLGELVELRRVTERSARDGDVARRTG